MKWKNERKNREGRKTRKSNALGLQPARVQSYPLPHGNMLDSVFLPGRLRGNLDFAILVEEFFAESMSLPSAFVLNFRSHQSKTLPHLQIRVRSAELSSKLQSRWWRWWRNSIRILRRPLQRSIDDGIAESKFSEFLAYSETSELDIGLCWKLEVRVVRARLVRRRDKADGANTKGLGCSRGSPLFLCLTIRSSGSETWW